MKVGIMQPYFFPYIGYWQLINAVDIFVIYDDVNYFKGGWINRNNILVNEQAKLISLKMHKVSQNKLINEIDLLDEEIYKDKLLRTLEASYKKALYYEDTILLINKIIKNSEKNLSKYLAYSIFEICKYIKIKTQLVFSSEIEKDNNLRGQNKIIEICKFLNGDHYINSIGGRNLYSKEDFTINGIKLNFLETENIKYKQFNNEFIPNLSIIDVLMFNSIEEIKLMLEKYTLC